MEKKASYELESVGCDHIRSDIIIIDDLTKKPLGRIWTTFIYDEFSNLILGLHMGFNPPSYQSVMLALKNAVLPKGNIKEVCPSVQNEWKAFGVPDKLWIDNGKEMQSQQLQDICESLGIELLYKSVGKTDIKSNIERLMSAFNEQLTKRLPGVNYSPIKEQGMMSKKNAVLSLKDFSELLNQWLIDIYSRSFHRSLKGIPNVLWEESVKNYPPRITGEDLDLLFGVRTLRRIGRRQGIQLHYLHYNSSELQSLRNEIIGRRKERVVEVIQNPDDLSKISVYNQFEKTYIEVPCLQQEYSLNLGMDVHQMVIKNVREQDKKVEKELENTKRQLETMINQLWQDKKVTGGIKNE